MAWCCGLSAFLTIISIASIGESLAGIVAITGVLLDLEGPSFLEAA